MDTYEEVEYDKREWMSSDNISSILFFFFQAEDGIRDISV